ncbi:MAG: biotin--[acetyl-CoA-carboxylase] ligase [Burkholderiales bacterium]|nr:biotin--[acetyl-CoA-carboxylase] ligase [Burkholderiales bacterium]OUT76627.1 MAG: biotin--[acetyl-CoA-carboxylase] ligase [Betaproteobacteria bacterium TMED22]|tara:strand:- start:71704 stop:72672 length:969 start_codon:yes stop_codon:yes gene_type:complete
MSLAREILSTLSVTGISSIKHLGRKLGANLRDVEAAIHQINQGPTFITRLEGEMVMLSQVSERLCAEKIRAVAGLDADRFSFEVTAKTASTNDDLLALIRAGQAQDRLIRIAETQTAGRGTKGRQWISIPGGSVTFSMLRSVSSAAMLRGIATIPLVVGLSLVRSINALADVDCRLKWPNDILFDKQKLAGVLIESTSISGQCFVVIGIGVNICLPQTLIKDIDQPAIDLHSLGASIDRNVLVGSAVLELDNVLERYFADGFDFFRSDWCAMHAYHNRRISFVLPGGRQVEGDVLDVDSNGALIVSVNGKAERYISGEVQIY